MPSQRTASTEAPARADVTAVVVHYETPALLEVCLRALRASDDVVVETIVVDNASSGFRPDLVKAVAPNASVIENSRNLGFAAAANKGLKTGHGRYLLVLNPDTIVEPATLRTMVEYLDRHPDVGCATARLVMENGKLDPACRRLFPTPTRAFYRLSLLGKLFPRSRRFGQYNLSYLDDSVECEIDAPCGAFMLVRSEIREQVGLLDESYFMYGEDLDWAYRIKSAGWRIMYNPAARALHIKRASSSQFRDRSVRAFYEAMRIFYGRHYEGHYPRWFSWLIYRAIDARQALELASVRLGMNVRGAQ